MTYLDQAALGGPTDPAGRDGVVDVVRNGDVTRILLGGDVDVQSARRLGSFLEAEGDGGARTIVVDLSAVEFVDSHGLRLFVDMHRRLMREGRCLVLVPPPDHV
jgi:anti-anti-sigma factor